MALLHHVCQFVVQQPGSGDAARIVFPSTEDDVATDRVCTGVDSSGGGDGPWTGVHADVAKVCSEAGIHRGPDVDPQGLPRRPDDVLEDRWCHLAGGGSAVVLRPPERRRHQPARGLSTRAVVRLGGDGDWIDGRGGPLGASLGTIVAGSDSKAGLDEVLNGAVPNASMDVRQVTRSMVLGRAASPHHLSVSRWLDPLDLLVAIPRHRRTHRVAVAGRAGVESFHGFTWSMVTSGTSSGSSWLWKYASISSSWKMNEGWFGR